MRKGRPVDKVIEYLERVYPRWASRTAIHNRALNNNSSAAELDKALQHLASEGRLESRVVRHRGKVPQRPPTEYRMVIHGGNNAAA